MLPFSINDDLCTRCGLCVLDCPMQILTQQGDSVPRIKPEQETLCMQCQHCLAVCPSAALSILGKNPNDSIPLKDGSFPNFETMDRFVRGRRSVRQYRDQNVDQALIDRLMKTLANAPTGVNRRELIFTLIDDKETMLRLKDKLLRSLAAASVAGRIPERLVYLTAAPPAYFERKSDLLFRGAPHALLVSAPPNAPCPREDVVLATAYFEFLAQSAGLGTVWWGALRMALETLPELKQLFDLPPSYSYSAILFGVPAVHYARTVQRDDAAVVKKVTLRE